MEHTLKGNAKIASQKKGFFTIHDLAVIGVMAAIIFVATYFIKIPIQTPTGPSMIKIGNIFCLLAGMLFGGVRGGLAAGIGSMFYDLLDPRFITSAPFTLVFFFIMAFVCGLISNGFSHKGEKPLYNVIGAIVGALSYVVLYVSKSIIVLIMAGSEFAPAFIATIPKMMTSLLNAGIAIVFAIILAPVVKKALKISGLYSKLLK